MGLLSNVGLTMLTRLGRRRYTREMGVCVSIEEKLVRGAASDEMEATI